LRLRLRPAGLPLVRQRWRHLAFLHWSVDPVALAGLLPPGLELDLWEGRAFVGLVPFAVRRSRAPFLPPVPLLSDFCELNLRTYVHRRGHEPGVWFFSLDATSRLAVWGARLVYKLPYFHASIAMEHAGGRTSFSSLRAGNGGRPRFACSYVPTSVPAEVAAGTLEFFLIERYLMYSWDGRRLRKARVWHAPYRVATAHIESLKQDVTTAAHIEIDRARDDEPIAHYADNLNVRIYPPSLVEQPVPSLLRTPALARPAARLPSPEVT
jgi:uncharacterized protein YqjF (DUF2071 family)